MNKTITRWASRLLILLLVACMAIPTAVAETVATAAPKPTSVKLDQTGTVKLAIGDTLTLNATLYPEGAQSTLKWTSSKKKIASVKSGVVTPKKVGTTTITVTTKNKKKAKVKIKVIDPYKPSKVYLDKTGTQTLLMGEGMQLNAALYPETAKSKLKWRSSNKRVAVVNSSGWVGAISTGRATITVTTRNKKKAKVKLKVIDNGNVPIWTPDDYKLPYLVYVCKKSHTIAILTRDSSGGWNNVLRLFSTGLGRGNVTDVGYFTLVRKERWHKWSSGYSPYSSRLDIGIYLHGPIYKQKNHRTIRPNYYNCIGTDCSSGCIRTTCGAAAWIYYNCPVGTLVFVAPNGRFKTKRPKKIGKKATKDPTDPGDNPEILITSFTLENPEMNLEKGAKQAITVTSVTPSNTSTKSFSFHSNNTSVATVDANGVVTAVGPGNAVIEMAANDDLKCGTLIPVNVTSGASSAKLEEAAPAEIPDEVIVQNDGQSSEDGALTLAEDAPVEEAVASPAEDAAEQPAEGDAEEADASEDEEIPAEPVEQAPTLNAEDNGLSFAAEEVPEAGSEPIIDQE